MWKGTSMGFNYSSKLTCNCAPKYVEEFIQCDICGMETNSYEDLDNGQHCCEPCFYDLLESSLSTKG